MNQGTYIENIEKNYHSYTFQIYNDENNYNINNIVLSSHNNEPYKAYLVTYNLTEEERSTIDSGVDIPLEDKTVIQYFDIEQINLSNRGGTCYDLVQVDTVEDCAAGHNVSNCSTDCCGGCYDGVYEWVEVDCGGGGGGTSSGTTSGTTSGGGGSTDGSNSDSDDSSLATSLTAEKCMSGPDITTALSGTGISLSAEQLSCITERGNCISGSTLISFIKANPLETAFFYEAVDALCNGGSVDVGKGYTIDLGTDCRNKIAERALNNSTAMSQKILNYFNTAKNHTLVIKSTQLEDAPYDGGPYTMAATALNPVCTTVNDVQKCNYNMLLDSDLFPNGKDLALASIVIHESIHAHLTYLFTTNQITLPPGSDQNFINMFNAYISYLSATNPDNVTGPSLNNLQHQYMTRYVNDMIAALKDVGAALGYAPHSIQMTNNYLKKLVYSGSLEETTLFSDEYPEWNDREKIRWQGIANKQGISISYPDTTGNQVVSPDPNLNNIKTNTPCF